MLKRKIILSLFLLSASIAFALLWLKSPYPFDEPNRVADEFISLLQQGDFERAHELTLKNTLVGKTPIDLQSVSAHQLCQGNLKRLYFFPLQTNGNRVRRWLRGEEVDMPEVHIEFEKGICPFKVTLRHASNGQWKVFNFQSHAG
jgi:hypothetical protein